MGSLGSEGGTLQTVQGGAAPHLYRADSHPHDPIISESLSFLHIGDCHMLRQEGDLDETR